MEPFVIQCTTCRARLKVSDQALIGDIVECPKCSSFVQVTPPAGWQAGAAAAGANRGPASGSSGTISVSARDRQPAETKSDSAVRKAAAAAALAPPPLPGKPGMPSAGAAKAGQPAGKSPAQVRAAASNASLSGASLAATAAGKSGASLTVPDLASEPTALARLWVLARQHSWISLGSLGALFLIAAIGYWVGRSHTDSAPPSDPSAAAPIAATEETDSLVHPAEAVAAAGKSGPENDSAASVAAAGQNQADVDATDEPATRVAVDQPELPPAAQPSASASSSGGNSQTQPETDPLDLAARALSAEPEPFASTNPGVAPPGAGSPDPRRMSSADDAGRAAADGRGRRVDGADSSTDVDDSGQARMVAHLQDKLTVDFKEVPLDQFVSFLSDYSTISFVIDDAALEEAGKGPKTKVTVKKAGATVEQVLAAALIKHGLSLRVEAKHVLITAAKP